ncbi:hypothetical protein VE04_09174, partial [Pseudogymnoascus sp. 24MN13]
MQAQQAKVRALAPPPGADVRLIVTERELGQLAVAEQRIRDDFAISGIAREHLPADQLPWNFALPAGDFVPGDWGFTSDQLLAENTNVPGLFPSDLLDFDALDVDFVVHGDGGGAWYDDFVLSSYFNGGEADVSLSSAQASVGESSARTQASSSSTSPSGQTDSSHVLGGLERVRDLSATSSSRTAASMPASSLSTARYAARYGTTCNPTPAVRGTPRTATARPAPSSDDIVDDPSDPDPVPWAVPPTTTSTTPRRQTRVTSKQIRAPTSRANPIAHAVPYITDLRVSDEGDLPPSHAMAQAMATNQHQRLEYLKTSVCVRILGPIGTRHSTSSRSCALPGLFLSDYIRILGIVGSNYPTPRRRCELPRFFLTVCVRTIGPIGTKHPAPRRRCAKPCFFLAVCIRILGIAGSNHPAHAAVARYIASSSVSTPYSPPAAASGEDGLGECRDRHKAVRKPVALCSCTVSTAVPATALCACSLTPTKTIPANLVAPPSRLSTGVLGGMLD